MPQPRASDAACPHTDGPLAAGQINRCRVLCPLHGHTFALADASCSTGSYAIRIYPVGEEDGQIVLKLGRYACVGW
ncbi:MAG: Rieske 2Fe-2S domain-containing protein [Pseudonocardiales bacterium]|nr:Rieske 2Fe-2S domain-containing protein [Pseudonocardiales bacterium]MBV9730634.1 Rieske 2Fe-2S domain-containing protein [Pseudonocardiales bacterium]